MFTISNILEDIDRGCAANNMVENIFSYRLVYFVNENGKGEKYYIDTPYSGLRKSLESIIRNHLSLTNSVVVAQTTALKNLAPIQRIAVAEKYRPIYEKQAKERQATSTGGVNPSLHKILWKLLKSPKILQIGMKESFHQIQSNLVGVFCFLIIGMVLNMVEIENQVKKFLI